MSARTKNYAINMKPSAVDFYHRAASPKMGNLIIKIERHYPPPWQADDRAESHIYYVAGKVHHQNFYRTFKDGTMTAPLNGCQDFISKRHIQELKRAIEASKRRRAS